MNAWRWALLVSLLLHGVVLLFFSLDGHFVVAPVATAALQVVPRQSAPEHPAKQAPARRASASAGPRPPMPEVAPVPVMKNALPVPVVAPSTPASPVAAAPAVAPVSPASVSPAVSAGAVGRGETGQPKAVPVAEAAVISPEDLRALCTRRPPPDYPAVARRRGEEGRVLLSLSLDAAGRIGDARVITGSGSRWLDEAALAAVARWGCRPATRQGVAVPSVATQTFSFVLEDRGG